MMKRIVFCGGGSAGHVVKNLILIREIHMRVPQVRCHYIGSAGGFENRMIPDDLATMSHIPTGKLRRYFSLQTFLDPFKILLGFLLSLRLLRRFRPQAVFSSGGYAALPVAYAAWACGIPVVTHETDTYPGLANRLIAKIATRVFLGYEEALPFFERRSGQKSPGTSRERDHYVLSGNPVRQEIVATTKTEAMDSFGFDRDDKVMLIVGGSQGAQRINELVRPLLPRLCKIYRVIHVTGEGKPVGFEHDHYLQKAFLSEDYAKALAAADLVISRAGGNALAELEALGVPSILLPLSSAAGDHQRKNAEEMAKRHPFFLVLDEDKVSAEDLFSAIQKQVTAPHGKRCDSGSADTILRILAEVLGL